MNGHAGINTMEATEHLKNILNVGKVEPDSAILNVANGKMDVSKEEQDEGETIQRIDLGANRNGSDVSVHGTNVVVYSSPLEYGASRNQVIIDNMVDYRWEHKYYPGKLITTHLSGMYLAYILKASSGGSYVRVLKINSTTRLLIKDHKTEVKDISFAHSTAKIILGSVDACGELLIHHILDGGKSLTCSLLLRVLRPSDWEPSEYNLVIWCLYIPEDGNTSEDGDDCVRADNTNINDDIASLLVVTHNEKAEIWNIDTILREHGEGEITMKEAKRGVQELTEHTLPISCATFSPDGTAIAVASMSGDVKFFQVNYLEKGISPRCLHQWTPHDGKPLSCLQFLDNHKNHRLDVQYWKFAVTGADHNTELKVWNCEMWGCLQTIRIVAEDSLVPCLKAVFDLSSKYLFLSDIKRKVLLVVELEQDPLEARAVSLAEFGVPQPVLSLATPSVCPPAAKLHWITTRSLQSSRILYKGNDNVLLTPEDFVRKSHSATSSPSREVQQILAPDWPQAPDAPDARRILLKLNQNVDQLVLKMASLTDVLHDQRCEIQNLQREVQVLRQDQKHNEHNLNSLDSLLTDKVECMITERSLPEYARLEELVCAKEVEGREHLERQLSSMEKALKREMNTSLFSEWNKAVESLSGKAVEVLGTSCKEVFESSVVPSFDKSCQQLFLQLNDAFTKGILEYLEHLEKHREANCGQLEARLIHRLANDAQTNAQEWHKQQECLLAKVCEEIQRCLPASRCETPVVADAQLQKQSLLQLAKQGRINDAFQQALSAMDVQLVVFLCESLSVEQVFGQATLEQPILLSLLSQLSADLHIKTEVKVRYIEDVIATLDSDNPITGGHMPTVLEKLQQRIEQFLQHFPNHKLMRHFKRISMAIQGLMKS